MTGPCRGDDGDRVGGFPLRDAAFDRVFEALADQRRRSIVHYLSQQEEASADIEELVSVAGRVEESDDEDVHETLAIDLYHRHLPMLADAGIVEFDPLSQDVRYRGHDLVEEVFEAFEDRDR